MVKLSNEHNMMVILHRIVVGTWAWAWWLVTDVQKIALGIRVTIIASPLICESLALTFYFSTDSLSATIVTLGG